MTPSLGVLIGLPIAGLLVLVGLGIAVIGIRLRVVRGRWISKGLEEVAAWGALATGVCVILVTALATGFFMWPWSAEYHVWTPVSGTVTATGTRLLGSSDNSTSQYYAEQINGQTYRCDDTRCSTVKVGDELSLTCKREWQYAGAPGWDCNFVSTAPATNGKRP